MKRIILTSATLALAAAGPALAALEATAVTDLNLRAGPGPLYEVEGVISGLDTVNVEGCLADAHWCKVNYKGETGWAYDDYLDFTTATETGTEVETLLIDDQNDESMVAGSVIGTTIGVIVGGPVAIAAGAVGGAIAGGMHDPDPEVYAYVGENPVDSVYLDGEVVVGAGIPEDIEVHDIPNSEYTYLTVNGQPVILEPGERKIVHIIR